MTSSPHPHRPETVAPVIPLRRPDGRPRPHTVRLTRPEPPTPPATLDERRTEVLYQRHRPSVFRFVRTLTFGDEHLAEDITQETFLRAWRTPDLLVDRPDGCHNWLTTVARNIVIDRLRRRGRRPQEAGDEQLSTVAAPGCDIDRLEMSLTLRAALAKLTPARREILIEVYLYGRSVPEAARVLGIPIGTAKSRIHYALRSLRKVLEEPAPAVTQRYAA